MHYRRMEKHGNTEAPEEFPKTCMVGGCGLTSHARGYCSRHYQRWLKANIDAEGANRKPCGITECNNTHYAKGLCRLHYMRQYNTGTTDLPETLTDEERFWSQIDKTNDCWLWRGNTADGCGIFNAKVDGVWKSIKAHAYSYTRVYGAIPDGKELHHECEVRNCVNPEHLEALTRLEHAHRSPRSLASRNSKKTHCYKGHEFTPENTYCPAKYRRLNKPYRMCRTCMREKRKK